MNIGEIAKLAGVSRATVSRYLNDGYVSEEKRERIQQVIQETGYTPSAQAQMLRRGKTNLIGVIVPKISSEAVSRMVDGITITLEREGYHVLLGNTDLNIQKEMEYLDIFQTHQVDGILFVGTQFPQKHLQRMKKVQVPIVVLGQRLSGYSCVYHDDLSAARDLTTHLIEAGCRTIAYLGVDTKDKAAGGMRRRGYLEALEQEGLPMQQELMMEGPFAFEAGYEHMQRLYTARPDIDGVFCATDNIAAGAMCWLKQQGVEIPTQVKVCGVGDSRLARLMTPSLTSCHYHYKTGGIESAKILLDSIREQTPVVREVKLSCVLQARESTTK